MFTCGYERFGMTFEAALVVVDRAELKFELQGSGSEATESNELGIQYRVFVTMGYW